jgi:hypothetical protein
MTVGNDFNIMKNTTYITATHIKIHSKFYLNTGFVDEKTYAIR